MSLREDRRLKPVGGVVGELESLVNRVDRLDGDDRPEDLFDADLHVGLGVGDDRGFEHSVGVDLATGHDATPLRDRFVDPALDAVALAVRDQRGHIGALVKRVAHDERLTIDAR